MENHETVILKTFFYCQAQFNVFDDKLKKQWIEKTVFFLLLEIISILERQKKYFPALKSK